MYVERRPRRKRETQAAAAAAAHRGGWTYGHTNASTHLDTQTDVTAHGMSVANVKREKEICGNLLSDGGSTDPFPLPSSC